MVNPKDVFWSLRHVTERRRKVTGLAFNQMAFVVSLIPCGSYVEWLAWHEGLREWTSLKNVISIFSESSASPVVTAPIPPPRPIVKTQDIHEFTMTSERVVDRRLNRRFIKEFRVEILKPGAKSFVTKTVNVSTSGMLLKNRVPDEYGRSFNARVSREDGSILTIYCKIIRDKEPRDFTRIKFIEVAEAKVLLAWLIDQKTS